MRGDPGAPGRHAVCDVLLKGLGPTNMITACLGTVNTTKLVWELNQVSEVILLVPRDVDTG